MRLFYYFLLIGLCVSAAGCVEPSSFVALENRVAALEMENNRRMAQQQETAQENESQAAILAKSLANLEEKFNQSPMSHQDAYAQMKYDIDALKGDLQKLEGAIEELKHRLDAFTQTGQTSIETQMDHLDLAISKNYEKIIQLEKYMGFEPTVAGEPSPDKKADETQASSVNEEQQLYDKAKKLFDEGDRENARIQFENFINKYPNSDNADNARFWIADSYYAEKWYEKAILEYQKVLENYPNSNKLAAARLKQGYAFAELGELANARLILKELIKKHPDSNEAKYAAEKLKHLQ